MGAELFNVDGQTDGHDEANFANALKNKQKRIQLNQSSPCTGPEGSMRLRLQDVQTIGI